TPEMPAKGRVSAIFVAEAWRCIMRLRARKSNLSTLTTPSAAAAFCRKPKSTDRLEHSGLVPIEGLGQHADGRPFCAMRFIHGDNPIESIRRLHQAEKHVGDPSEHLRPRISGATQFG